MGLLLAPVAPLQARARHGGGAGGALDHLGQLARGLGLVPHDLVGLVVQELARGISLPLEVRKMNPTDPDPHLVLESAISAFSRVFMRSVRNLSMLVLSRSMKTSMK